MVALGLLVEMLNAERGEEISVVSVILDKKVLGATPEIDLRHLGALLYRLFSKEMYVVLSTCDLGEVLHFKSEITLPFSTHRSARMVGEAHRARERRASTEALGEGQRDLERAVAAHRKSRYEIVLTRIRHALEVAAAEGGKLLGNEGEILCTVSGIRVPASRNARHYYRDAVLARISLNRGAAHPDAVIVRKSVEQIESLVGLVLLPVGSLSVGNDDVYCDLHRKCTGAVVHFKKSHKFSFLSLRHARLFYLFVFFLL